VNRFLAELARRAGAVLQTHFVAVPLPPTGIEYSLCLIYRDGASAAQDSATTDDSDDD
jgi:hypothetical protein